MLQNPHNLLGKWAHLSPLKQHLSLLAISLLGLAYPLWQTAQNWQQQLDLQQQLQQQRQSNQHQQQILHALQTRQKQQQLSPELARQVTPINQQIQQLLAHYPALQLQNSQWQFAQRPLLKLQLQGYFLELQDFLLQLLRQIPQLHLSQWQIQQLNENEAVSIQTEILLQFE